MRRHARPIPGPAMAGQLQGEHLRNAEGVRTGRPLPHRRGASVFIPGLGRRAWRWPRSSSRQWTEGADDFRSCDRLASLCRATRRPCSSGPSGWRTLHRAAHCRPPRADHSRVRSAERCLGEIAVTCPLRACCRGGERAGRNMSHGCHQSREQHGRHAAQQIPQSHATLTARSSRLAAARPSGRRCTRGSRRDRSGRDSDRAPQSSARRLPRTPRSDPSAPR